MHLSPLNKPHLRRHDIPDGGDALAMLVSSVACTLHYSRTPSYLHFADTWKALLLKANVAVSSPSGLHMPHLRQQGFGSKGLFPQPQNLIPRFCWRMREA